MNHRDLVIRAGKWLANSQRCGVVLLERSGGGEFPDAIGWGRFDHSILVECKTSRADFLADAQKLCRVAPETSLGTFRYFLAPKGLIKEDELPDKWGLLEISESVYAEGHFGRIRHLVEAQPNELSALALRRESGMLVAALRKVRLGAMIVYDPTPAEQDLRLAEVPA